MRVIPGCDVQEEQKSRKKQLEVRETIESAIMKGDPKCPDLIATSVYDTKPVQNLIISNKEL